MLFKKNKALLELGYYNDQNGILDRYFGEENGWNEHLENTKNFILSVAKKKSGKKAAILGSGWLLDVPVKELSELFEEVHLFDVIHPKEIKQKTKKYKNVFCYEQDLTGGYIEEIYKLFQNISAEKKTSLTSLENITLNFTEKYDFVSSVNILNQLDILLVDYIRQFNIYSENELSDFRKQIQQNHIDSLPKGISCLISDFEEIILGNDNEIEKKSLIYTKIPESSETQQWQWKFDYRGTYNQNKKTTFNVIALTL